MTKTTVDAVGRMATTGLRRDEEEETHNNQIDHGGWVGVGSGNDNKGNDGGGDSGGGDDNNDDNSGCGGVRYLQDIDKRVMCSV